MPIVKTQLREISAKRNVIESDVIKMSTRKYNINIVDVVKFGSETEERSGLIFVFEYVLDFPLEEPKGQDLGQIKVVGEIFSVDTKKASDAILDEWKKEKKLSKEILTRMVNIGLEEATVHAISQAHKIGLPKPIPLPRLKAPKKESKAA